MPITLPRGQITNHLLDVLESQTLPVGDCDTPTAPHGWQGEPNATGTNFIPWIVLGVSNSLVSSGSLGASQSEWRVAYYLSIAGVTRKQTEAVADQVRDLLVNTERDIVGTTNRWQIQQVRVNTIGGVTRIGATNPSYYVQTDTIEIWLSKEN